MVNHVTSWAGIINADEQYRRMMARGSDNLLMAMARELEKMGARCG